MKSKRYLTHRALPKRNALVVALALGMGISGLAYGQATSGTIFGNAPAGDTVTVTSTTTGASRTVTVGSDGQYTVPAMAAGSYTVTLLQNGNVISSRDGVHITVGGGTVVNFVNSGAENATNLSGVQVVASSIPKIDVSSVTSSNTVTLTAQDLRMLPLGQNADALALLAPKTTPGSDYFGGISFAGAGVTENAYYVDGYNVTALYDYTGTSYTMPYGAIAQTQTLTGGFSAKYGRADGGVINQLGKSGTNEWHFGARLQWVPRSLRASPRNFHYPNIELTSGETFTDPDGASLQGTLYDYNSDNKGWNVTKSAYVGGPLIKDKLFAFVAVDLSHSTGRGSSTITAGNPLHTFTNDRSTTWYGKITWNINDNNVFNYTRMDEESRSGYGRNIGFDYDTLSDTADQGPRPWSDYSNKTDIFHYTGYLGDNATLSVLYGRTTVKNPSSYPVNSSLPFIAGANNQDPAITGGAKIGNAQTVASMSSPLAGQNSKGLRVDFTYRLGDHLLAAGVDNMHYWAVGQGQTYSGPGYVWIYGHGKPGDNINAALDVGAPGGDGYYVSRNVYTTVSSMSARQRAWYVQDDWQVSQNVLVSVGLRNDGFQNYSPNGTAFVKQDNQWEPRLGVSWDVFGDSSLKLYANAGRYYLALPQAVANRQATASLNTNEYFTYTGIDSNGIPTGLTPVPNVAGTAPAGVVSANGEFGQLPDPDLVAAKNLKPQYQDAYIVGFDKTLGEDYVYGASAEYRSLGTLIDDGCYPYAIRDGITQLGLDPKDYAWTSNFCHLFNPNRTNIYKVNSATGGDAILVPVSQSLTGLPKVQRDYYALNLYIQHPFDGTWMGRVDYTFSRSWGNSEGQVRSDIGQGDISITEDWDYAELMSASRGYLSNHKRHQLKAYGAWQVSPDWMLSGTVQVFSGTPVSCLGFFGSDPTNSATNNPGFGYGSDYHWCEGQPSPPGAEGSTPWSKRLDLGVTYRPSAFDHKLALKMYVFNVFNQQVATQLDPNRFARYSRTVSNTYHMPISYTSPRYVRFTVTYDY